MTRHALQGSCRAHEECVGTSLANARFMRKQDHIVAVLLLFGSLISPLAISSQSRSTFTRTTLSKMDVLSRAVLFEQTIADAARKEDVDPRILWTIAYNETRFRPWLTSPKNAQGLMQFIPATASRFGLTDPYEPNASIYAAARYVTFLEKLFNGRLESVLAAYNAGEGTVLAYLHGRTIRTKGRLINPSGRRTPDGVPPYRETINYVSQGVKVHRWLQQQGRFRGVWNETEIYATRRSKPLKKDVSEENDTASKAATTVLYDPRTGGRFLVDNGGQDNLRPIDRGGPVIISPDLRGPPSQKARSTFAGISRP